jgi:acetyl esterase
MTIRSRAVKSLTVVLGATCFAAITTVALTGVAGAGIPEVPYAATENVTQHLQYSSAAPLDALDVVQPATSGQNRNAVLLIHGGGYNSGSKKEMDEAANSFVNAGWVAFNMNYSLNGFPAETNDAYAAVVWIKQNAATYGVDPDHIAVLGSSSGGTLAGMLATEGPEHGAGVAAVATWSGPLDLALLVNDSRPNSYAYTHTTFYVGGCSPSACPSTYSAASPTDHISSSTAPWLVANSTDEIIPLNQAQEADKALIAAGVPEELNVVPGMLHATEYESTEIAPTMAFLSKYVDGAPATTTTTTPPTTAPNATTTAPHHAAPASNSSNRDLLLALLGAVLVLILVVLFVSFRPRGRRGSKKYWRDGD